MKGPGSEGSREREGQGANRPGSESSRKRIGQGSIGRFTPGSTWARERKGCESCPYMGSFFKFITSLVALFWIFFELFDITLFISTSMVQ